MSDQDANTKKPFYRRVKRWQIVTAIVIIASFARLWAAWQLPVDADEPTYLKAGSDYAQMIKTGDLTGILQYDYNQEHPPLVKLMYSLPYLFIEPRFGYPIEMTIDRLISAFWGVLAVLVLALIDPLAGIFLALDTMAIKYTSQVYLESLPLFAGLLAIYAFRRYSQKQNDPVRAGLLPYGSAKREPAPTADRSFKEGHRKWLWVSAGAIGAAVAGKYLYALLGIPVVVMFLWMRPRRWKELGLYLMAALAAFFVLDPALWSDPIGRLWASLSFHLSYSTSSLDVVRADYPWYQALNWISDMVPWHPQVFIVPGPDALIFILALFGGFWAWKKWPWTVIWAVSAFLVLLAWPTKWPQYTLTLIPALCLVASTGLRRLVAWFRNLNDYYSFTESILPQPGKLFWIVLFLFLGAIVVGKLSYEVAAAQARSGWTLVQSEITPLPSNAVHAAMKARDGRMVIATDAGVSIWRPDERSPWGDSNRVLTPKNSGLVDARVLSLLEERSGGGWWFGTMAGLSYWDGKQGWTSYGAADLGLEIDQILCLLQDSQGRIWAGTKAGAAVWDGKTWKAETASANGLGNSSVFAMAEQNSGGREYLWFGTLKGVSRLDEQNGVWQHYDVSSDSLNLAGVADMLVGQDGKVWVATWGNGLSVWDGQTWTSMRSSTSGIPLNTVTKIIETAPGVFWVGFGYANQPGGLIARFDGKNWQVFDTTNSGFNGSEPNSLALDGTGKLWIGSAVNGLQIYQEQ